VPGTWQDLARLRAAYLRIDGDPTAVRPGLERLAAPTNPWRHSARELLGLSGLKAGDYDVASRWFDQIAADRETPQGLAPAPRDLHRRGRRRPRQTTQ
jgi:hypothetical protein